tara:strand:- start:410 stop:577 length:168 start_codon:yes stop_codon:yes gene_type:complete
MAKYKLHKDTFDGKENAVIYSEGSVTYTVPFDPDNTDYQGYLEWVDAGNTPEAAD